MQSFSHRLTNLVQRSQALEQSGEIEAALRQAHKALNAACAVGEADAMATALLTVARCHHLRGHDALTSALAGDTLALAGLESAAQAGAWLILGICTEDAGALAEAELRYRQTADLARALGEHLQQHTRDVSPLPPAQRQAHSTHEHDLVRLCSALLEHIVRLPQPLHITLLGDFAVSQGHCPVERHCLQRRRAGKLLALLLLAPGRHLTTAQATEALFPGHSPDAARDLLHHATSALRHALEPDLPGRFPSSYLEVADGQVRLTLPAGSWIDVEAFEAHCRQGEWEEALALYAGELLPEERYAEWAFQSREQVALLHQRALLGAAKARLAAGRWAEALDACQQVLTTEPWQEQAVLLGMRACMELHDVSRARRLYKELEQTLRLELDTVPQPELQAFYHQLTPTTRPLKS